MEPDSELLKEWTTRWSKEQEEMKLQLSVEDDCDWLADGNLRRIGGVDISFSKKDSVDGCVTLVVLSYPSLEVIYEQSKMVRLTLPYICGFLAFREVPFMEELIREVRELHPDAVPDIVVMDGNGVLHPKGFGAASQLGVVAGIPTIGVAKKFLAIDGLCQRDIKATLADPKVLPCAGSSMPIVGKSGRVHGKAVRTTLKSTNPVFVSVGHKLSLDTAVRIVSSICTARVPEPTRQADLRSREFLRVRGLI
eukprot:gene6357-9741_t